MVTFLQNFEDKKLLLKLNWRLSETGKLVCTFCDNNQYDLQKFITHVNACISKRVGICKYICIKSEFTILFKIHNENNDFSTPLRNMRHQVEDRKEILE